MSVGADLTGSAGMRVRFDNGNEAQVVRVAADADPAGVLATLGLAAGAPVIALFGGAGGLEEAAARRVETVVAPAVARAAKATGAYVVTGGTDAGVMQVVGKAVADRGVRAKLVGVAPAGMVTYPGAPEPGADHAASEPAALEPHHARFALAGSDDWGGETPLLIGLAGALAGDRRVVAVVAGGGKVTTEEVRQAVRCGWTVVLVEGTGGTAGTLVGRWRTRRRPQRFRDALPARVRPEAAGDDTPRDATLEEIIDDGELRPTAEEEPVELARALAWELQDAPVLKNAWVRFARYDHLAKRLRKTYERLQRWILTLGVVGTFLALLQHELGTRVDGGVGGLDSWLHWAVVLVPVSVAALIATATRMGAGKRWVMLRAAAEAIKREIYRYRTGTGAYRGRPAGDGGGSPEAALAAQVASIDEKLLQTEASSGALPDYRGPLPPPMFGGEADDDGLSPLTPERYLTVRVDDQLSYYRGRTTTLQRRLHQFQIGAVAVGAGGTVLAAAGLELWIGLTTGITAAVAAYLGSLQVDNTLIAYNQVASRLDGLRDRWQGQPAAGADGARFDGFVDEVEAALELELSGWVKQMSEALERVRAPHGEPGTHP